MSWLLRATLAFILTCGTMSSTAAWAQPRPPIGFGVGPITNLSGSIVHADPYPIGVPGAKAWRVLYRSAGLNGEQIVVSGIIIAPDRPAPSGGWPVVAWAHPTTGIARQCAPSLNGHFAKSVPDLAVLIQRGFVIAATDYQGLGTDGPHPYLVGPSAAHSVLDSVRAARLLAGAGSRFVVWGHSQGGHAALWSGQLARSYAPDLTLLGVAAAAPASELASLLQANLSTPGGKAFTGLALLSWSKVYDADLRSVVNPKAMAGMQLIGNSCMSSPLGLLADAIGIHLLPTEVLIADPTRTSPWSQIIQSNTPRFVAPGVPVFLAQGTNDTVVLPAITRDFARRLCSGGTQVRLVEMSTDHLGIATSSADQIVGWAEARFARQPSRNDCPMFGGR